MDAAAVTAVPRRGDVVTRFAELPEAYRWCPRCNDPVHRLRWHGHLAGCGAPVPPPQPDTAEDDGDGLEPSMVDARESFPTEVTFTVPGPPVGYKRVGGTFTKTGDDGTDRQYRAVDPKVRRHRRAVRDAAKAALPYVPYGAVLFDDGPVEIWVTAVHEQPKNGRQHPDAAHWSDWDNIGKLVSDSLGWRDDDSFGVYTDDGQVVAGHVRKAFGVTAHTVVRVARFTDGSRGVTEENMP